MVKQVVVMSEFKEGDLVAHYTSGGTQYCIIKVDRVSNISFAGTCVQATIRSPVKVGEFSSSWTSPSFELYERDEPLVDIITGLDLMEKHYGKV